VGFIGCIAVMFLISKVFLAVTILVIAMIYYLLQRKKFQSPWGDVRGGVFYSIAEWAAQKAYSMPYHPKLWKPSILLPVETPEDFKRLTEFTKALISPSGRLYYLSINEKPVNKERVDQVLLPLKEENLFTQQVLVEEGVFEVDFSVVLKTLSSTFLGPNTVFLTLSDDPIKQKRLMDVLDSIKSTEMGLMCLHLHNKYGTGQQRKIHLWLRDKSPNQNLAVLSALQLSKNWNAQVTLSRVVPVEAKVPEAEESLRAFVDDARLPVNTEISVYVGSFMAILHDLSTDLHIMGMPQTPEGIQFETMTRLMNDLPASIMFVSDSGLESALV
jgi:solute carrier family 12 (sodium/potassium/chloride transporter), member 2